MPNGRNCIRFFEWQRCSRVLQAQRRKQWRRIKKPFSDSVARVCRMGASAASANGSLWADEDCRRLDGAGGVARPSLTDYQKGRSAVSPNSALYSVLFWKLKERQTMHLQFSFCVLASKHQLRMARWRRRHSVSTSRGARRASNAVERLQHF